MTMKIVLVTILAAAAALVLPAVAFLLGNLVVMQESTQVEFCGSCHVTMSPIVEGLAAEADELVGGEGRVGSGDWIQIWGGFASTLYSPVSVLFQVARASRRPSFYVPLPRMSPCARFLS